MNLETRAETYLAIVPGVIRGHSLLSTSLIFKYLTVDDQCSGALMEALVVFKHSRTT